MIETRPGFGVPSAASAFFTTNSEPRRRCTVGNPAAIRRKGLILAVSGLVVGLLVSGAMAAAPVTPVASAGVKLTMSQTLEPQADGTTRLVLPFVVLNVGVTAGPDANAVFSGLPVSGRPGYPALPMETVRILLPPLARESSIVVTMTPQVEEVAGVWDVAPAPPLAGPRGIEWPQGATVVGGRIDEVYSRNAYYPQSNTGEIQAGRWRQWKVVTVPVFPYRYNPVTHQLSRLTGGTLMVQFASGPAAQSAVERSSSPVNRSLATWRRDLLGLSAINFSDAVPAYDTVVAEAGPGASSGLADYVVITTSTIMGQSANLPAFVAHKQSLGFTVRIITENSTEDENHYLSGLSADERANNIRNWLASHYASLGIQYVLLVGDPRSAIFDSNASIPMKMCYPNNAAATDKESPTDLYYADLTGNWDSNTNGVYGEYADMGSGGLDLLCEVAVGRIPIYDAGATQVGYLDSILGKTVAYESTTNRAWRSSYLGAASFQDDSYVCDGATMIEQFCGNVLATNGWSKLRMYQQGSRTSACDSAYASDVELRGNAYGSNANHLSGQWQTNDFGIVMWWGHGADTWTQVGPNIAADGVLFANTQAAALDDAHPSFLFPNSCNNGTPEVLANLCVSVLRNGAIAALSPSRVTWYAVAAWSTSFFSSCSDNASYNYNTAKRLVVQDEPIGNALTWVHANGGLSWQGQSLMNHMDFNLYGDPAVGLATGGTMISETNLLSVAPAQLTNVVMRGANAASQSFTVWNSGSTNALNYVVTDSASWLSCSPASGVSAGEVDTIALNYMTTGLVAGSYMATVTVSSAEAANSPLMVGVMLLVTNGPASLPVVGNSGGASNVTATSAVFSGYLSSTGSAPTYVRFYWGTSDGGTNPLAWSGATPLSGPRGVGVFSTNVTGLASNTLYYYRAFATNTAGTAWSTNVTSFVTPGVPWIHYVSASSTNPLAPYTNWTMAAKTLQLAVNVASNGAMILVTNGVYAVSGAVMVAKAVLIQSVNGAAVTVVDGQNVSNCVTLANAGAVLDGFTVTRGRGGNGGGIISAGTVRNCVIVSNTASLQGGGLYLYMNASNSVSQCTIQNNNAGSDGGGVACAVSSVLRNCLIASNRASNRGGGVSTTISGVSVQSCTIAANSASNYAGGVYFTGAFFATNNIIMTNSAPLMANCSTGGVWAYTCSLPLLAGQGNMAADPGFVNISAGNYRLGVSSPCVDAGTSLAWMASATDLDGTARLKNGRVDMGVYELEPAAEPATGSQSMSGYRAGGTNVVTGAFTFPTNSTLLSLLWRPVLPAGWSLVEVSGDGSPQLSGNEILFTGDLSQHTIQFQYRVAVEVGQSGPAALRGEIEYAMEGMANPVSIYATPDPLVVSRQQTLIVETAHGLATPAVGTNTYFQGTVLTNSVTSPEIQGATRYVCSGWVLMGQEPQSGSIPVFVMAVTNDATLTWLWNTDYWLAVTNGAGGYVTGATGWLEAGTTGLVTAVVSPGYHFAGWAGDVPAANTNDNPLALTMSQARTVIAQFALNQYVITASAGTGGTITPAGAVNVQHGEGAVFAIAADPHFHIAEVTVDGLSVGITNAWEFTNVTNNHTIAVTFAIDTVRLVVQSAKGGAMPVGTNTYNYGSDVACGVGSSPVVSGGTQSVCQGWAGTGSVPANGNGTNIVVHLTNDSTLVWVWKTQYWLVVTNGPGGSVTGPAGWLDAGSTGVVQAVANTGYHFAGWVGTVPVASTNDNPLTLLMSQSRTLTAQFAPNQYTITASAGPGGAISPNGTVGVSEGGNTTFTISASNNFRIAGVLADSVPVGATNTWTFTNVTNNHTIAATFAIDTVRLVVQSPKGGAMPTGTNIYNYGSDVACSVGNSPVINGGTQSVCQGWAGTGSVPANGNGTNVVVNLTNDSTLAWVWKTQYWLALTNGPGGSVTGPGGWLDAGSTGVVQAVANTGYHFAGWLGTVPAANTNDNPLSLTMNQAQTVIAQFVLNLHTITASAGPGGAMMPGGAVEVSDGGSAGFIILASNNYHTVSVEVDGVSVGVTNAWTFINVTNDHTLAAAFALDTVQLVVQSVMGGATPAGTNQYNYGTDVACGISNSPVVNGATQYVCQGWSGSGSVPSTGSGTNVTLHLTNNSTLVWNWQTQYRFDALAEAGGDIVTSNGWRQAGAVVSATATALPGFVFTEWIWAGGSTSANPLELSLDRSYEVTARFAVNTALVQAVHACAGYRSPDTGAVVACSFYFPVGQTVTALSWQPELPVGWAVAGVTNITLTGPFTNSPVQLSYAANVPGDQPVTNGIRGSVSFRFAGMTGDRAISAQGDPLLVNRYHSADYRAALWSIDGTEVNRILSYWRAGQYHCDSAGYDGYAAGAGATNGGGRHSADFQGAPWVVDASEAATALAYWRAGNYTVSPGSPDGYMAVAGGQSGLAASPLAPSSCQSAPVGYDPGELVAVTNSFEYSGTLLTLTWRPVLPDGWTVVSVAGDGNPEFRYGSLLWTGTLPPSPVKMIYTVRVPLSETGTRIIRGVAGYYGAGLRSLAETAPADVTLLPNDKDSDGMPDAWERHYSATGNGLAPDADEDHDGLSNVQECRAGTDPLDQTSCLKLHGAAVEADGAVVLRWSSIANRFYTLGGGASLERGFSVIATNIPATPPDNVFRDQSGRRNVFYYRINVEP